MSNNIIGANHLDYVTTQIKARQEVLGKSSRNSEDIAWMNGRTSFIRLASSVEIADEDILQYNFENKEWEVVSNNGAQIRKEFLNLPDSYSGPTLSKQLVLEGGILNEDGSKKFGITNSLDELPSSSSNYGFGGMEFGPQPMPGISSFSLKTYNKGSLREANLKITAHNRRQFEYLESVYLRLGYTVLLEWGDSHYPYSENGEIIYKKNYSSLVDTFLNTGLLPEGGTSFFYTEIEKLRKETQGNYDGFLGRVQNFSWTVAPNGTYEINLKLITIGSVIENLKLNVVQNIVISPDGTPKIENQEENTLLVLIKSLAATPKENSGEIRVGFNWASIAWNYVASYFSDDEQLIEYDAITKDPDTGIIVTCRATYGEEATLYNYIRFGTFLEMLNQQFFILDKNGNPNIIEIDTSNTQYCFSNGMSISGDPSKMVVSIKTDEISIFHEDETTIEQFHTTLNGVQVGDIMNLYFSEEYLSSLVKESTDEKTGDITLYPLLKKLTDTANNLLGGVNKINLRIVDKQIGSKIKQVLEFYDEVVPFESEKLRQSQEEGLITVYGFNPKGLKEVQVEDDDGNLTQETQAYNRGSFVTDYSFQTNISKETGNMIAIGAQANGYAVGEDATLFSKWNVGLVDRIIPQKLDVDSLIIEQDKITATYIKLAQLYLTYIRSFRGNHTRRQVSKEIDGNDIGLYSSPSAQAAIAQDDITITYKGYGFPDIHLGSSGGKKSFVGFINTQKSYFQKFYTIDAISNKTSTPFIGFIPIKLSITLDGLSGIRIFDKLSIDSRFLPPNYGDTLEFIITGLDHKIESNKWSTQIETLSIPKVSKKLSTRISDVISQFPPITTFPSDLVGYYTYNSSALVTMLEQTVYYDNGTQEILNTNGNLLLPGEKKNDPDKDKWGKSPLISIGNVSKVKYSATFALPSATTSVNESKAAGSTFEITSSILKPKATSAAALASASALISVAILESKSPATAFKLASA